MTPTLPVFGQPPARSVWECDTECYTNFWLCKFRNHATGELRDFALMPGGRLDIVGLSMMLGTAQIITFNGMGYDIPMITLALSGVDCLTLKSASDAIIKGLKPWAFYEAYKLNRLSYLDHIDLQEVAPGVRISLKTYGGRMHSKQLQDLPYDPAKVLTLPEIIATNKYCGNDLETTADLYEACKDRLDLRCGINEQYGIDVRSKSDAQIAEAIFRAKIPNGRKIKPAFLPHGHTFFYRAPEFVGFVTPQMGALLQEIQRMQFVVNDLDQLKRIYGDAWEHYAADFVDAQGKKIKTGLRMPAELAGRDIRIGAMTYRMGIGGLHSQESKCAHFTFPGLWTISDHDVASYYPSLILLMGMFPAALGMQFLEIYREVYVERLAAKAKAQACKDAGDDAGYKHWDTVAGGLKIVLNGTFGKLGSKYSILFSPEQLIQVTITGQLCLLMLIEALELNGINVVSANTDGIVLRTPVGMESTRDNIIAWWQTRTGLDTEATFYSAIYQRDVNNYLAYKTNGECMGKTWKGKGHKGKGAYGLSGVKENKHPDTDICVDAVVAYLDPDKRTPLEQTVMACKDVRKFIRIRAAKGGAWIGGEQQYVWGVDKKGRPKKVKDGIAGGQYLGKTVRWYYGRNAHDAITYKTGNKVSESAGAVPVMRLPDEMPTDIDYGWYVEAAAGMLRDIGVTY